MKRFPYRSLLLTLSLTAVQAWAHYPDVIVRYSTLNALKASHYDGEMTYGEMVVSTGNSGASPKTDR